jgi:hypothetical protein
MRSRGRQDGNQREIVDALIAVGASVQLLSDLGHGAPDLLVGWREVNTLLEVKDPAKPPSQRKLTPDQVIWHRNWRGQVVIVHSISEALEAIGLLRVNC